MVVCKGDLLLIGPEWTGAGVGEMQVEVGKGDPPLMEQSRYLVEESVQWEEVLLMWVVVQTRALVHWVQLAHWANEQMRC